ncbi:MAG: ADP-ribosylglycohydrolase family protein [Treponemataceae bacterium]
MPANKVRDALLGLAVGDALGVPHEFRPRHELERNPISGMDGWGTWNRPPGTWSDDASLSFCLAETLCSGYDLRDLAARIVDWRDNGYWTADGIAFSVGRAVESAVSRLRTSTAHPASAGLRRERDNGNGSLMRVLPAAFFVRGKPSDERAWITAEISSLTHGHRRAQLACIFYVELADGLLNGRTPFDAYQIAAVEFSARFAGEGEIRRFERILSGKLHTLERKDVLSSGYVVDALESSVWCLLTTGDYRTATLEAVNLGGDTDTVGSLTGGLAGIAYGAGSIPSEWLATLSRKDDIIDLADRLAAKLGYE